MDPISAIFTKIIGTMLGAIIGTIAPPPNAPKPERAAIANPAGAMTTPATQTDRKRGRSTTPAAGL